MKRPEGMPFYAYRMALKKLNERIDLHLRGTVLYRGQPFIAAEYDIRVKPLALAVRQALA